MANKSIKITKPQADWLRQVRDGKILLRFPLWSGSPRYVQRHGSFVSDARDRGVLRRLRSARLIQDEGTVTGRRADHSITLTPAGTRALENHDA